MNGQHLRAFLWLRWRIFVNQMRRGGIANAVILAMLSVGAILSSIGLFVGAFLLGLFVLGDVSPTVLMYVWDGLVVAFLFSWGVGLLTELQRTESLALHKFLHLPVSLSSAFLINYLSSLASFSFLLFVPAMVGLSLGLILGRGLAMVWLLPMLAVFLLMVSALTYQFQGWLATLMANPRRRRTILVLVTMGFILFCQMPNLFNLLRVKRQQPGDETLVHLKQEKSELEKQIQSPDLNNKDVQERLKSLQAYQKRRVEIDREIDARKKQIADQQVRQVEQTARLLNVVLPPGWLPAGVEAAAASRPWPVVLALLGPALIGSASLWRAYATTLRLYKGAYTAKSHAPASARPAKVPSVAAGLFLEKQIPGLSEQAAAIFLGTLRSLLRAPEAKMLLLTPVMMLVIFGSLFFATGRPTIPQTVRPLLAAGAMSLILFSLSQILGNQFGVDRNGFRVYVLSPVPRRAILLGKNLAVAPLVFSLGAVAMVLIEIVYPMRVDHLLALVPRFLSMYLLFCLLTNALSILVPMRISANSLKPVQPGGISILFQLLFMTLCPTVLALPLIPTGIEFAAEQMGWRHGIPLDLLLSLLGCVAVVYLYGLVLQGQGAWLQAREQRIMQVVTKRAE